MPSPDDPWSRLVNSARLQNLNPTIVPRGFASRVLALLRAQQRSQIEAAWAALLRPAMAIGCTIAALSVALSFPSSSPTTVPEIAVANAVWTEAAIREWAP